MRYLLAADTGGTFTDIVVFDQRTKATQFGKTTSSLAFWMACPNERGRAHQRRFLRPL